MQQKAQAQWDSKTPAIKNAEALMSTRGQTMPNSSPAAEAKTPHRLHQPEGLSSITLLDGNEKA